MQREQVQKLALEAGFKLKKQPSGEMDLNPYVYTFVEKLFDDSEEIRLLRDLHYRMRGFNRYNGVNAEEANAYLTAAIESMHDVNMHNDRNEDF